MQAGNALREIRGGKSQHIFSMELNISRESVSAYETGRAKIPKDVSVKVMDKFDDPFFAMALANEYTKAWSPKLDGANVDLHRCSVKEKATEDIKRLLESIEQISLTKAPRVTDAYRRKDIENMLMETLNAITALNHLAAVLSKDYNLSWKELWEEHYIKLKAKGLIK